MAKSRIVYFCKSCGYESAKWVGKCSSCGEWNTFVEEVVNKGDKASEMTHAMSTHQGSKPLLLREIETGTEIRIDTSVNELNRVLGGGIVRGSLTLLGGEPGIGKSTLVLQLALNIPNIKVLYASGEESVEQLKLRAERLGGDNDTCFFVSETNLERLFQHVKTVQPQLLIVDSIQTLATDRVESSPGSVSQIRECAAMILRVAKENHLPVLLIGHINKEGALAGPKILEHIVDTVLQFEGDRHYMYRILRSIKNRFGTTAELGIFEMQHKGLREVSNPSELLLSKEQQGLSGLTIATTIEGARPFLIEVQALVSSAVYGTPQRSSTGYDLRRLNMLLAVLEKRAGFKLGAKDVFLNIAGGLKVNDPAVDLAVITAILSSNVDIHISPSTCMAGEVGLSGEIRPVNRLEQRIREAEKLGFSRMIVPDFGKSAGVGQTSIELVKAKRVEEVFRLLLA